MKRVKLHLKLYSIELGLSSYYEWEIECEEQISPSFELILLFIFLAIAWKQQILAHLNPSPLRTTRMMFFIHILLVLIFLSDCSR